MSARTFQISITGGLMAESLLGNITGLLVAVLGGGLGVEGLRRWSARKRQAAREPLELTARILDEGDELRRRLLDESTRLRAEHTACLERAHQAELALAVLTAEHKRLLIRLERKDMHVQQLRAFLTQHGIAVPELPPADNPVPTEDL